MKGITDYSDTAVFTFVKILQKQSCPQPGRVKGRPPVQAQPSPPVTAGTRKHPESPSPEQTASEGHLIPVCLFLKNVCTEHIRSKRTTGVSWHCGGPLRPVGRALVPPSGPLLRSPRLSNPDSFKGSVEVPVTVGPSSVTCV